MQPNGCPQGQAGHGGLTLTSGSPALPVATAPCGVVPARGLAWPVTVRCHSPRGHLWTSPAAPTAGLWWLGLCTF